MATKVILSDLTAPTISVDPYSVGTSFRRLADITGTQGTGINTTATPPSQASGTYCGTPLFMRDSGTANTYAWITVGLAPVTISGTVTANLWMSESNMNANCGSAFSVIRCQNDGTFIESILGCRPFVSTASGTTYERGVELGTSRAAQNWTATPASSTLNNGDRLVIAVGFGAAGGTMAGSFTIDLAFDGSTAAADGDSWIQFTENLAVATTGRFPRIPAIDFIDPAVMTKTWQRKVGRIFVPDLWLPSPC